MESPRKIEVTELESDSRREFLKHVLSGAASATVLMVYSLGSVARTKEPESDRYWKERSTEHQYAYVIDITKCIGCGSCVRACKIENNVPDTVFRTWIERYVITNDGIYIDSPEGGLKGFEEVNAEIRDMSTPPRGLPAANASRIV